MYPAVIKAVLAKVGAQECLPPPGSERSFELTLSPLVETGAPMVVYWLTEKHVQQLLEHLQAMLDIPSNQGIHDS